MKITNLENNLLEKFRVPPVAFLFIMSFVFCSVLVVSFTCIFLFVSRYTDAKIKV